jgi:hypothetical protein
MANFSDLIEYFETLAAEHVSIRHSSSEKHFFRFEIDEVLAGIHRTDVCFPMLILEGYSFSFTDNKSDNVIKNRQGAFVLMDHISDPSDYDALHEIWDDLEAIGDDILARIRYDKQLRTIPVVRDFNLESVSASLILNEIGNNAGIRFMFTISSPLNVEYDADKWI